MNRGYHRLRFGLIEENKKGEEVLAPNYHLYVDPVDFFRIIQPKKDDYAKRGLEYAEVLNKIVNSRLLDLIFFKPQISRFAGKRYINKAALEKKSALESTDDLGEDAQWVALALEAYNKLLLDPILAWQMSNYFPTLAQFIFSTLASTGDYSNEGAGGSLDDPLNDPIQVTKMMFESFGVDDEGNPVFKPAWTLINTGLRIEQALEEYPFRANIPPMSPDIFHLRIGAANFYVPPISINVNTAFRAGSLTGGAIRQKNTPKFNTGYKDTAIGMRLYFPNYEEIWGISILDAANINLKNDFSLDFSKDNEQKIDKFLSSLRGLVAAFKASPIISIKNEYINKAHGITGVALSGMTVSTVPNFPFCLVVDLEMMAFNHKPFLPMIRDFNQAIHWGRYRHYMGKAALDLDRYVNREFLKPKPLEEKSTDPQAPEKYLMSGLPSYGTERFLAQDNPASSTNAGLQDLSETENNSSNQEIDLSNVLLNNVFRDWEDGSNISLYVPEKVQTRIFTPDVSTFRTKQEMLLSDTSRNFWAQLLYRFGLDINETGYGRTLDQVVQTSQQNYYPASTRRRISVALDILLAGQGQDNINDKVYNYLAVVWLNNNPSAFALANR
jgi:hypothetical protein